MLHIRPLEQPDIDTVCRLAREVWQSTYASLISQAQIDFMLTARYAPESLHAQIEDARHCWRLAVWNEAIIGFAHAVMDGSACKLDKLYVSPGHQHRGMGAALLNSVLDFARGQNATRLWLQVNRGNTRAINAYRKYGFARVEARVFDIGGGFVMDDDVMEMSL